MSEARPDTARGLRVLLVEDNPSDVRLLQELLRDAGHEVDAHVTNVDRLAAAVEMVREHDWDIVLLDLSLPDALGVDSCCELITASPACPPVIVLTGNADRVVAARAVAMGAQDFLVKGHVDAESLLRSIEYARERHQNQQQLQQALRRESAMVDRLQELDRLKNRFVAMASHELRTPLASISGFAATLSTRWEAIEDVDRLAYIQIIDEQAARLSRLVDDLLVLSRIESGSLDAKPEMVDLRDAVEAVITELAPEPTVEIDLPQQMCVVVDPDHLEQMLMNYVTNAVKYGATPIVVQAREHDASFVDVLVVDRGAGVPDDVASMLFEEFVRGKHHSAARIPGTGLGLSIVRGLARAQGGDAWHEPNQPTGSVFALRLPSA